MRSIALCIVCFFFLRCSIFFTHYFFFFLLLYPFLLKFTQCKCMRKNMTARVHFNVYTFKWKNAIFKVVASFMTILFYIPSHSYFSSKLLFPLSYSMVFLFSSVFFLFLFIFLIYFLSFCFQVSIYK